MQNISSPTLTPEPEAKPLSEIGRGTLFGSGFEDEQPEPDFDERM
jgi:hypothetical protein